MISLQYGGSNAHDKIETTRGNSKAKKEIFTTLLRHYSNTFTDKVKQESLNVFLGVLHPVALLKPATDYYLHNTGYAQPLALPSALPQKWWLLPLLQFEQSIYKDVATAIMHSNAILFCPACRKTPVLKNALLCAYCGALLHRSAPAIDAASFYSFQPLQNGLIWEHLLPDEKWPFFGSVRNSHGFCEIGKLMELPCFAPHYITSVPSPLQTHSQVDEASDATPVAKPIFWENWNTRTQSTVQYVGYDNQKGVKAEEEEEEDADVAVEKPTPRLKTTPPAQEDEEVEDEEEHRLLLQEEEMLKGNGRSYVSSTRQSRRVNVCSDSFFQLKDDANQFCVFPTRKNTMLRELM